MRNRSANGIGGYRGVQCRVGRAIWVVVMITVMVVVCLTVSSS